MGLIEKPILQILNAEKSPTERLRIAKMEDSLNPPILVDKTGVTLDIDKDKNRFYVQLQDSSLKGKNEVMIDLVTSNPDSRYNEKTKVLLSKKPGQQDMFESNSLMLVSNNTDDEFALGKVPDNDIKGRDRTFKTALGGQIQVEYPGKNVSATADVPIEKVLNINVTILKRTDGQEISKDDVYRQLKEANEAFAQVGVKVNLNVRDKDDIQIKELPEGVDLSDGLSDSERDILFRKLGTSTKDDVHIFYTGSSKGNGFVGGFALMRGPDDLVNNIVVGEECLNMSTLAHEIGHLLRGWREHDKNKHHYPFDKEVKELSNETQAEAKLNLMFDKCVGIKSGIDESVSKKSIYDSKRLTSGDEKEWHKSYLLENPETEKQSEEEKEDEDRKESRGVKRSL